MEKLDSEFQLYPIIGKYLMDNHYDVAYNVPVGRFHPRIFDIVGINDKKIVSIEVKLNNFKKTLDQAITRLYYSDKVFVAFPESYISRVEKTYVPDLKEMGIGLISVNQKAVLKLKASQSIYLNFNRKRKLLAKVKVILNKHECE